VAAPAIVQAEAITRTENFQSVCGVETEPNTYFQYRCEVINNYNGAIVARTILRSASDANPQIILVWLPESHVEVQIEGLEEAQQSIYQRGEGMTSFHDLDGTYRYYFSDKSAAEFELRNFQEQRGN
jgi:hypothetical protein